MKSITFSLFTFAFSLCACATAQAQDAIAFRGDYKVYKSGMWVEYTGLNPVTLDFKIYDAVTNGTLLWARRIPVSVMNGVFTVALSDGSGLGYPQTGKAGNTPKYNTLAEALASRNPAATNVTELLYLEYGDPSAGKTPARVPIAYEPFAVRASAAAKVETAVVAGTIEAESATLIGLSEVKNLSAEKLLVSGGDIALVPGGKPATINQSTLTTGAAFSLGNKGISGYYQVEELPNPAITECGRIVYSAVTDADGYQRRVYRSIFYSTGDSTALPGGTTAIYNWSLGGIEK